MGGNTWKSPRHFDWAALTFLLPLSPSSNFRLLICFFPSFIRWDKYYIWQQFQWDQQHSCHLVLLNGYSCSLYISQKDCCRVAWPVSFCGLSVQMMWANLGIKKLELILGHSCTSKERRCAELIGQLTGHFPYWGSFVRLALFLIYSVSSASELLVLLHCLSLCGFILYYPWPVMTYQAVNTYNETWAAFFWQSCKQSSVRKISSSSPDLVCFIKVWVDNSNQHLTCSENTIALRANLASEIKACKIAGKKKEQFQGRVSCCFVCVYPKYRSVLCQRSFSQWEWMRDCNG